MYMYIYIYTYVYIIISLYSRFPIWVKMTMLKISNAQKLFKQGSLPRPKAMVSILVGFINLCEQCSTSLYSSMILDYYKSLYMPI